MLTVSRSWSLSIVIGPGPRSVAVSRSVTARPVTVMSPVTDSRPETEIRNRVVGFDFYFYFLPLITLTPHLNCRFQCVDHGFEILSLNRLTDS